MKAAIRPTPEPEKRGAPMRAIATAELESSQRFMDTQLIVVYPFISIFVRIWRETYEKERK